MIFYFTGTGNSKFVAEYIADRVGDTCCSMNDLLKRKVRDLRFTSDMPFVFSAPIYAWGYPKKVVQLINKMELIGCKKVYFLATMGSQTGEFEKPLKDIALRKDMEYMGSCGVVMPNNFILGGNIPDRAQAAKTIAKSAALMDTLAELIANGERVEKCDWTPFASVASGMVNSMFAKYFMSSKNYVVSDSCVSCGKCAEFCPVNNICLDGDGVPVFGGYCLSCYGCINRCPKDAINIGKKTETTRRYVCPSYDEWKKRGK